MGAGREDRGDWPGWRGEVGEFGERKAFPEEAALELGSRGRAWERTEAGPGLRGHLEPPLPWGNSNLSLELAPVGGLVGTQEGRDGDLSLGHAQRGCGGSVGAP